MTDERMKNNSADDREKEGQPADEDVRALGSLGASEVLLEQFAALKGTELGRQFADDRWACSFLEPRKSNGLGRHIVFGLRNPGLERLIKTHCLIRTHHRTPSLDALVKVVLAARELDAAVGDATPDAFTNAHFEAAAQALRQKLSVSSANGRSRELERFARWLRQQFGLPVHYTATLQREQRRGSAAELNEAAAFFKAVVAHFKDPGISEKDKFYVCVTLILMASGLRLGEVMTLPKDCLNLDPFSLTFYPEKRTHLAERRIVPEFQKALGEAVAYISAVTDLGRAVAASQAASSRVRWHLVAADPVASVYFINKVAHRLTAGFPDRDTGFDGIWSRSLGRFLDPLSLYLASGQSLSEVAEGLRVEPSYLSRLMVTQIKLRSVALKRVGYPALATTSYPLSPRKLCKFTNSCMYTEQKPLLAAASAKINTALVSGAVLPAPLKDPELEQRYTDGGDRLVLARKGVRLRASGALMIVPKWLFANNHTSFDDYQIVTVSMYTHWLDRSPLVRKCRASARSDGAGAERHYTSKELRKWLHSTLHAAGLSKHFISIVFGKAAVHESYFLQSPLELQAPLKARLVAGNTPADAPSPAGCAGEAFLAVHRVGEE